MMGDPLAIYRAVVERVPAYRRFLEARLGAVPKSLTTEAFATLPAMDKTDYILRYPYEDLCLDGTLAGKHCLLRSSGTSGRPFYWPKLPEEERNAPVGLGRFMAQIFQKAMGPTLVMIGFAIGPWATGSTLLCGFRVLAQQHPGLTVVSPGARKADLIEALRHLSPRFQQTILLTYPSLARSVMVEAAESGVMLKSLNLMLIIGGEGFSESARTHLAGLIQDEPCDPGRIWSVYGSTDFGDVGAESHESIAIRRFLDAHALAGPILGTPDVPMIFQMSPTSSYFEIVDGELLVTRLQGIPIVRYRTGDRARILPRNELAQRLRSAGFDPGPQRDGQPFLPTSAAPWILLTGRTDGMVFLNGANITVEQVRAALESPALRPFVSSSFRLRTQTGAAGSILEIVIEDAPALRGTDLRALSREVERALSQFHSELADMRQSASYEGHELVRLVPASQAEFGDASWKSRCA